MNLTCNSSCLPYVEQPLKEDALSRSPIIGAWVTLAEILAKVNSKHKRRVRLSCLPSVQRASLWPKKGRRA